MRYILLLLMMTFAIIRGEAQLFGSIRLGADTVLIGDPLAMEVRITLASETTPAIIRLDHLRSIPNLKYQNDTVTQEKTADLTVLDWGSWKVTDETDSLQITPAMISRENGKLQVVNTIKIAVYNAGTFFIPPPVVRQGNIVGESGNSARLEVKLPVRLLNQDTTLFNPIRDIIREKKTMSDYLGYLYALAGLLLVAGLGYYFARARKKEPALGPASEEVVLPPHVKALQALQELDDRQLWQQGKVKDYQTSLTDIIRSYLEERYSFSAMEMTTDEIVRELSKHDFDMSWSQKLREILQVADLVKFAKAEPDSDIHSRFMGLAVDFVEKTAPSDTPNPASDI